MPMFTLRWLICRAARSSLPAEFQTDLRKDLDAIGLTRTMRKGCIMTAGAVAALGKVH